MEQILLKLASVLGAFAQPYPKLVLVIRLVLVIECADVIPLVDISLLMEDVLPGDVAKGFAGGADFVMLGGMFAGHDEGGGNVITKYFRTGEVDSTGKKEHIEEKQFVEFYGMSSQSANNKHFGGLKDYRSPEGRTVPGPIEDKYKILCRTFWEVSKCLYVCRCC